MEDLLNEGEDGVDSYIPESIEANLHKKIVSWSQ